MSWHPPRRRIFQQSPEPFQLDSFSEREVKAWKENTDKFIKYHWDFYSCLAYQRTQIQDKIKDTLLGAAEETYVFNNWQRAVKYRYSLIPLSPEGSLVDPGGRFNIGRINPYQHVPFPGLYVGEDKSTSIQESLSQQITPGTEEASLDFALTNSESISLISLSGCLGTYIDLNKPERLTKFVNLIKNFKIPNSLFKIAKELKLSPPGLVRSSNKLMKCLMEPNWRGAPMLADIPSGSQIFGQLVHGSGIEGILYRSKFNDKKCLAIFPQNFETPNSFIQLDHDTPGKDVVKKLDFSNIKEMKYR